MMRGGQDLTGGPMGGGGVGKTYVGDTGVMKLVTKIL